jgi:hypothetical protein
MENEKPPKIWAHTLSEALNEIGYNIISMVGTVRLMFDEKTQKEIKRGIIRLEILPHVREGEFSQEEQG